jgi:Bacterial phosphonate metabolism protein (PhnI)
MYVAVKGGEKAIDAAHLLLAEERRGNTEVPSISLEQISEQLTLAVDRVMNEGSLYDREWAALAIKQSRGDMIEAIFLVRAARTTLSRFGGLQGHSRWPDPWTHLRLHPSPARLRPERSECNAQGADRSRRQQRHCDAACS